MLTNPDIVFTVVTVEPRDRKAYAERQASHHTWIIVLNRNLDKADFTSDNE